MSDCVLTMGELIDEAMRDVRNFDDWVYDNLPFYPSTARKIRAMWLLHQERPEMDLPEPWKAICLLD